MLLNITKAFIDANETQLLWLVEQTLNSTDTFVEFELGLVEGLNEIVQVSVLMEGKTLSEVKYYKDSGKEVRTIIEEW